MARKNTRKRAINSKTSASSTKGRKTKKRPWGIIILAIVIIILMLFMTINPNTFNKKDNMVTRKAEPEFKKEGELDFFQIKNKSFIKRIDIEIADNNYERARGMMYRKSMDEETGMLFIMNREEKQSFWMRNTHVSLDILYLNEQFHVVKIHTFTQPLSDAPIPSEKKARYVLEVKGGFCDIHGIKTGDSISYKRITLGL